MLTTLKEYVAMGLIAFYSLGTFLLGLRAMFYALEDARNKDLARYLGSMGMGLCWFLISIALAVISTS